MKETAVSRPFNPLLSHEVLEEIKTNTNPRLRSEFLSGLELRGLQDATISAMRAVDRQTFLPYGVPADYVYAQTSFPILVEGENRVLSTVSQPDIVATMTDKLSPEPGDRILEVGGGSGYQAAIVSRMVGQGGVVHTVEFDSRIAEWGSANMYRSGNYNVVFHVGDGGLGYEKYQPYDRVILTASLPPFSVSDLPVFQQMKQGGRMVAPLGGRGSEERGCIAVIGKDQNNEAYLIEQVVLDDRCIFVPMQGWYGWENFRQGIMIGSLYENLASMGWNVSEGEYLRNWVR